MKNQQNQEDDKIIPRVMSYMDLRKAVGILAISLPVILVLGSVIAGGKDEIQKSISMYYHTNMGNVLVGVLCATALFMFSYKGYGQHDYILAKLGCIFAIGTAMFPCSDGSFLSVVNPMIAQIHWASAVLFFLVIAYFSLILFIKKDENPSPEKLKRNVIYIICGIVIILSLLLIVLYEAWLKNSYPGLEKLHPIFWLETLALWAFGVSWLTKGGMIWADIEDKPDEQSELKKSTS